MDGIPLSRRKATALHFIAWGIADKEIASQLGLSVKMVEAQGQPSGLSSLQ